MQIRKIVLGLAILLIVLHCLSLLFISLPSGSESGLKGSSWGARALAETFYGKLFYVVLDGFIIWVLVKLWQKK